MDINNRSLKKSHSVIIPKTNVTETLTGSYQTQPIKNINTKPLEHEQAYPFLYGHDKWPYKVEKAFTAALRLIMKSGTSKIKVRNKNYGRNELISLYIRYHTGEVRTKKQISSHIQVWKKSILNKTSMGLTQSDAIILNLIERGAEQTDESLKRFYSIFEFIIDSLSKESLMHKNPQNSYINSIEKNVSKFYQYGVDSNFNNYNNGISNNIEVNMNDVQQMPYQGNQNSYMIAPTSGKPAPFYSQYAPIENIQVQSYQNLYNYNNKATDYPKQHTEYNTPRVASNDNRYTQQAPEFWQDQSQMGDHKRGSSNQRMLNPSLIDGNNEQSHILFPPQYPTQRLQLQHQVPPQEMEDQFQPQIQAAETSLQVFPDNEHIKLPLPVRDNQCFRNSNGQFNSIHQIELRKVSYMSMQGHLDNQKGVASISSLNSQSTNDINNMTPNNSMSSISMANSVKYRKHQKDHQNTNAVTSFQDISNSAIPLSASSRGAHTAPYLYQSSSRQSSFLQKQSKQGVVMLPAYPYYQAPNQTQSSTKSTEIHYQA